MTIQANEGGRTEVWQPLRTIGLGLPATPSIIELSRVDDDPAKVVLRWNEVTTDVNHAALNFDDTVVYNVYYSYWDDDNWMLAGPTLDSEYVLEINEEASAIYMAVEASTEWGTSALAKSAMLTLDNVEISADAESRLTVQVVGDCIYISGAVGANVSIVSVDGRNIMSAVVDDTLSVPVASGVYVVKSGATVAKVAVP